MAKKSAPEPKKRISTSSNSGRLARTGDNDKDVAAARALDGDTANDDADAGVQDLADEAGVEADGENDKVSDAATRTSPSGFDKAKASYDATTKLEGGGHEVLTQLTPQADETLPPSRKHYGIVTLRTEEGDEMEFGVSSASTARHLANVFNAAADELSRRSM